MKARVACTSLLAAVLTLGITPVFAGESDQSPGQIAKILSLLTKLETEVRREDAEAKTLNGEAAAICTRRKADLEKEIEESQAQIRRLKAFVEEAKGEQLTVRRRVKDLNGLADRNEKDLAEANKVRSKELRRFLKAEKDLLDTVSTLERATALLTKDVSQRGNASAAFVQEGEAAQPLAAALSAIVQASALEVADKQRLMALVQTRTAAKAKHLSEEETIDMELDGLSVPASVSASLTDGGGVLKTLNTLLLQSQGQLQQERTRERERLRNFESLRKTFEYRTDAAKSDLATAQSHLADAASRQSSYERDLASAEPSLKESKRALYELEKGCMSKERDFKEASKARADELEAFNEARKTLAAAIGQKPPSFLQVGLHYNSKADQEVIEGLALRPDEAAGASAAAAVRQLANRMRSPELVQLAGRVDLTLRAGARTLGADPLKKVKSLISNMITKLESEGSKEVAHKAFCEKETVATKQKFSEQSAKVLFLNAKIDEQSVQLTRVKKELTSLRSEVAELDRIQKAMNLAREREHAAFLRNKVKAEETIGALQAALKILRQYYSGKKTNASRGRRVLNVLENAEVDATKTKTELVMNEEAAIGEHTRLSKDNSVQKGLKGQEVTHNDKEATDLEKSVNDMTSDRRSVKKELVAMKEYMKKLDEQCIAKPEPFEERQRRRKQEVTGLRQALAALASQAVSFLQTNHLRGSQA